LIVKSNSLRATKSMTGAALRLPAGSTATLAPGFERGVHRFERFDSLDIRSERGRRRMQHGKIVIARICGNLSEPKTTRRGASINLLFSTKAAGWASQVGYQNERISRHA
jgi:hypothetical protein